ncbi:MAG: alanine racemase [Lachnospiraceae bacterium]|nr:alanine racemase [Lachnospiraceae bacterium]
MDKNRVWAEVDLDHILFNMNSMHENLKPDTRIYAVLKTDGYGHGAVPVAQTIDSLPYLEGFAVATIDEARELINSGLKKPVLILGYSFHNSYDYIIEHGIRPAIFSYEDARVLSDRASSMGKDVSVHIKIDTGMGRIGFLPNRESLDEILRISKLPNIRMEGIFTHFSRADEEDKSFAEEQLDLFLQVIKELSDDGLEFPIRHCANSAAILEFPDSDLSYVRAGISMYGLWPSEEMDHDFPMKSALSLYSHIIHIKTVEAETPISYGGTYVTAHKSRIATVPVGYGDGYPRLLSNTGYVLVRGHKAPIVGRVCMDMMMVDVTSIPEAEVLDKVTLVGEDGNHKITLEALGEMSGRFNYEFACDLGNRIPRVYYRNGEVVAEKDYL